MKWSEKSDMKTSFLHKENRKHARTPVCLPVHFLTNENGGAYPGLTIDASESGLLIQTLKEMPVGIKIDIEILFPKELYLANFKAEAEIVWKDICSRGDWEGYQYGLKFIRVSKEDYLKLRRIVSNALCLNEIDLIERRGYPLGLVVKQNESIKTGSYRVLIVDDEEMIRNFLCSLLPRYGHSCEVAKGGIEALEKIKRNSFDAVVVDVVMPHMDGVTLTEELLRLYSNLPVMLMTGHAHEHSAESAMAAGAREFIKKPFSIQEFIMRFDKMMRDYKGEKALLALSLTDELTGLCNRRRFFILTEQYLKVAIRTKKRPLLLFIDMDDLKGINDRYGHNEGDQVLIDLANILKRTFRKSDIIARIGGDEFVVLLESTDENSETLMTRLHENVKDYNAQRSQGILSISLGTTQFDPESPISIDELLSKADTLMYAQKRRKWKC
ncbi:MAG: diguanylate cyclase [Thermodesulfobacteriota bacterium]|jgi:diguanylate cyclase (GGDEF)-like protein